MYKSTLWATSLCFFASLAHGIADEASLPIKLSTSGVVDSRLVNIHVEYASTVMGGTSFTYGSCNSRSKDDSDHLVARNAQGTTHRLVWVVPQDAVTDGCVSAWSASGVLLGRSDKQIIHREALRRDLRKRSPATAGLPKREDSSIPMSNASGIDVWGPWFDGVAALEGKNLSAVDVGQAKGKRVAIVGAGMAGLMTYLVLHQAGLTNVQIIEGSDRLGGRVRTEYLSGGPFDYSYQEMGPMRIPQTTVFGNATYNISDHQLVFQLAEEMNRINGGGQDLRIDLIPFINESPNGLVDVGGARLDNGWPPTKAQVAANSSLVPQSPTPESVDRLTELLQSELPGQDFMIEMAENMFQAHSDYIRNGPARLPGDQWSEFAFIVNYLNATLGDENAVTGGVDSGGFLEQLYEQLIFSPSTAFKTIDGGMSRLPQAFHPLVDGVTNLNSKVERISWEEDTGRLRLQWRSNYTERDWHEDLVDYAIIAAPFSVVSRWRLPSLTPAMKNAINTMAYGSACKVALEYKTRFWERFDNPIYGSCSTTTDIPGIGQICYPSFNLNGSGPATVLASFSPGRPLGVDWTSLAEEQHVQYVVDAMAEIHGQVAHDEYTGKYSRKCWSLDELAGVGWTSPTIGNHQLYLPEFFTTHKHMIFVGEHTSYTHAWIASALESGVRGAVQLLLELGLIDEAKEAVNKWMARWISIASYPHDLPRPSLRTDRHLVMPRNSELEPKHPTQEWENTMS